MDLVLLRISNNRKLYECIRVSILILMDLVLLPVRVLQEEIQYRYCFNPYFNGSSTSTFFIVISLSSEIVFQSLF